MYISQFLGDISYIAEEYNTDAFSYELDNEKPFLEVFDSFLKKTGTPCGNKLFEHALWILKNHVVYVGTKQDEELGLDKVKIK